MVAAKDNVNTRIVALVSLIGVILLVVTIMATDAAYSWTRAVVNRGNESGDPTKVIEARKDWKSKAEAAPAWAIVDDKKSDKYVTIPVTLARDLVLADRKK
ncbi:MAG: hypothetical protein H6832_03890 [Planctomycetes bacterium]|nr:hypothetical protein [Planctomycetota bacterium]MCB9917524.1 hypothetical protein [Planctomycetota bacterium]